MVASSLITLWQIDGEKVETVIDLLFLSSKMTVDSDYSNEMKRHFLLRRKAMTNLAIVLKSRDIHHFTDKDPYSQNYGFSSSHVWM